MSHAAMELPYCDPIMAATEESSHAQTQNMHNRPTQENTFINRYCKMKHLMNEEDLNFCRRKSFYA
ncbi:unnamed protein product [Sphenostylis stenocarpa]|uniref:Uncharacterized protein n=1 Tax=Sphenostylis stenocarpa TaxID=92480 RepID=A0AA86RRI6_9FABA|nr:unnamed protein product [Sphenostylis stenocarpa]